MGGDQGAIAYIDQQAQGSAALPKVCRLFWPAPSQLPLTGTIASDASAMLSAVAVAWAMAALAITSEQVTATALRCNTRAWDLVGPAGIAEAG